MISGSNEQLQQELEYTLLKPEEIPSEEASTLQIGSVAFPPGQCTSPQLTDYLTKMGIKTVPHPPYIPDLAPCDFWLFIP